MLKFSYLHLYDLISPSFIFLATTVHFLHTMTASSFIGLALSDIGPNGPLKFRELFLAHFFCESCSKTEISTKFRV